MQLEKNELYHTGTFYSFPFQIAIAQFWKDQRILSKMNRINSFYIQTDFHKTKFKFKVGKTTLEGARRQRSSQNDTNR